MDDHQRKLLLDRKERQQDLVDEVNSIILRGMKDNHLYINKEGKEPGTVDIDEFARFQNIHIMGQTISQAYSPGQTKQKSIIKNNNSKLSTFNTSYSSPKPAGKISRTI